MEEGDGGRIEEEQVKKKDQMEREWGESEKNGRERERKAWVVSL